MIMHRDVRCSKALILSSISMTVLALVSAQAAAQTAAESAPTATVSASDAHRDAKADRAPSSEAGRRNEDIVITGSRVVRNGFASPTPLTVLSADVLAARADINISDAVNQLPQTANSVTQTSQPTAVSGGALGVNQISLRGLGPTRTLILLDGKRVIDSSVTSALGM
jgi:iron complex outermembrane receptor protein